MDTMETETPVKGPHRPPSAIVSVPKKLLRGKPGCPNSPGTYSPKTPYKIAKKLTVGNGQPTDLLAASNTVRINIKEITS